MSFHALSRYWTTSGRGINANPAFGINYHSETLIHPQRDCECSRCFVSSKEPSHVISSPCPLRSGLRSGSEQGKVLWLIPYLDALWNFNHLFTYCEIAVPG